MPTFRKLELVAELPIEKKKRGRPVGSKNKVKNGKPIEQETLYLYKASDGCEMKSGIKSKFATFTCPHGKDMKFVK